MAQNVDSENGVGNNTDAKSLDIEKPKTLHKENAAKIIRVVIPSTSNGSSVNEVVTPQNLIR
jgi:hypothetical protein